MPSFSHLAPGQEMVVTMLFNLPPGEYEFLGGYGGGVHATKCVASNMVSVDVPDEPDTGRVTVQTGEGTFTTEVGAYAVRQEDVGVDFHPGATVEQGSSTSVTGAKSGRFNSVSLTTTDPFDAMAKPHKDKYAKGNTLIEQPDNLVVIIVAAIDGAVQPGEVLVAKQLAPLPRQESMEASGADHLEVLLIGGEHPQLRSAVTKHQGLQKAILSNTTIVLHP